jgi:hypothetical protein
MRATGGGKFIGAARYSLHNVAPTDGQVSIWVKQQQELDIVRNASLIFEADILSVGSSIMAAVPASRETVVARVNQVLDKPESVALSVGQQVVVIFSARPDVRRGSRLRIFGNGRIFADTIAVEAISSVPIAQEVVGVTTSAVETAAGEEGVVLRSRAEEEALKERLADASVVVVGHVREVRIPQTQSLTPEVGPISEHNPEWREAIVEVEEGIKGAESGTNLVVRFPASEDVMWFDYPKLAVGERAVLILERDTLTGAATATLAGSQVPAYVLSKTVGSLPASEKDRVRSLLP